MWKSFLRKCVGAPIFGFQAVDQTAVSHSCSSSPVRPRGTTCLGSSRCGEDPPGTKGAQCSTCYVCNINLIVPGAILMEPCVNAIWTFSSLATEPILRLPKFSPIKHNANIMTTALSWREVHYCSHVAYRLPRDRSNNVRSHSNRRFVPLRLGRQEGDFYGLSDHVALTT